MEARFPDQKVFIFCSFCNLFNLTSFLSQLQ
jgi:hypothetical protein